MKYCIYCGKSLNDVAQFCEFCGKKQLSSDDVSQNSTEAETGEITNQIKIIYAEPPSKEKVNEPIQREPVEYTNTNIDNELEMEDELQESYNDEPGNNTSSKTINIAFDIAVLSGLIQIVLTFLFPEAVFLHAILMTSAIAALVVGTVFLVKRDRYKRGTSIAALIISVIILLVEIYRFYQIHKLGVLLVPTWNLVVVVGLTTLSVMMIGKSIKAFSEQRGRQNLRQSGQLGRLIFALVISVIILVMVGWTLISMRAEIARYMVREFSSIRIRIRK